MNNIKSLADQLRLKINEPEPAPKKTVKEKPAAVKANEVRPSNNSPPAIPKILEDIRAYDNADHKSMVHVRFDAKTLGSMNQFKLATGVDVTKLVAYSVAQLFKSHPELKTIIKEFFQKLDE
jgi:hypothetical protein